MKTIRVEALLGHVTGLNGADDRPTELMLAKDFLRALPLLTISGNGNSVKKEFEAMKQDYEKEIQKLKDAYEGLSKKLEGSLIVSKQDLEQRRIPQIRLPQSKSQNSRPKQRIIQATELDHAIREGYSVKLQLQDGRIVLELP